MDIKHMNRPLSIKAVGEDGIFCGYASVFGRVDHHNEIVARGAFTRTLTAWQKAGRMPAMLWMHDTTQPIGLWLQLQEDPNGLAVEGKLALRTRRGAEAYELLKLGALTGLSIGYRVVKSRIDSAKNARILSELDLFEISLVTFPANEAARIIAVKSPYVGKNAAGNAAPDAASNAAPNAATIKAVAPLHRAATTLGLPFAQAPFISAAQKNGMEGRI